MKNYIDSKEDFLLYLIDFVFIVTFEYVSPAKNAKKGVCRVVENRPSGEDTGTQDSVVMFEPHEWHNDTNYQHL